MASHSIYVFAFSGERTYNGGQGQRFCFCEVMEMEEFRGHTVTTTENLRDAGCDEDFIRQFLEMEDKEDGKGQAAALARHRESLLEDIHAGQRKLDILDYFIYNRRKSKCLETKN